MTVRVARHHQAKAQALGASSKSTLEILRCAQDEKPEVSYFAALRVSGTHSPSRPGSSCFGGLLVITRDCHVLGIPCFIVSYADCVFFIILIPASGRRNNRTDEC